MFFSPSTYIFIAFLLTNGGDVEGTKVHEVWADQGQNVSLVCGALSAADSGAGEEAPPQVMWVREGREAPAHVQPDGSLRLHHVSRNDSGLYTCLVDSSTHNQTHNDKVKLIVRTPPPALTNVTIQPSTILALILWQVTDNGGYPIISFTAQYRLANSDEEWKPISPNHISPNSRQIDVYKLEPNTTYAFRIWATNQLGPGEITEVESKTLKVYEEIALQLQVLHDDWYLELAQHFLKGVEQFDTRIWIAAVGIVMGTLTILGFGTCYLLYLECRVPGPTESGDDQEVIELVPNIILNPGFEDNTHHTHQHITADENSNNETSIRLNNNTVIQPRHV